MAKPADQSGVEKAKTFVIAGFLGAGKTTLLKHILSWETDLSDTVVIVNEFGDVGIDGSLLKGARSGIVELAGGCICCTMQADLKRTLLNILNTYKPQRILIEATGVADPKAITQTIQNKEFRHRLEMDKVITVLEADFWKERQDMGGFFLNQLQEADLILLNKIDTLEETEIHQTLQEVHETIPRSRVIPTVHCRLDPGSLWLEKYSNEPELRAKEFFPTSDPPFMHNHENQRPHNDHDPEKLGYVAFSFEESEPLDEDCFWQFTQQLPWELFRMKGWVRFPDRTLMVNYAGGRSEWGEWEEEAGTRLAFVGLRVDTGGTIERLKSCIAQS
jgi:G3E family GTPase